MLVFSYIKEILCWTRTLERMTKSQQGRRGKVAAPPLNRNGPNYEATAAICFNARSREANRALLPKVSSLAIFLHILAYPFAAAITACTERAELRYVDIIEMTKKY
jgi:hypothetical protein